MQWRNSCEAGASRRTGYLRVLTMLDSRISQMKDSAEF
jgi:hypothetical protein